MTWAGVRSRGGAGGAPSAGGRGAPPSPCATAPGPPPPPGGRPPPPRPAPPPAPAWGGGGPGGGGAGRVPTSAEGGGAAAVAPGRPVGVVWVGGAPEVASRRATAAPGGWVRVGDDSRGDLAVLAREGPPPPVAAPLHRRPLTLDR